MCAGERAGSAAAGASALDVYRLSVYVVRMAKRSMQEATFLILTALASGSQHGYGIITDVIGISDGRVKLRAGTLYTALDRLRADGLVEVDREEIVDSRLRRYYRLTAVGTERLAEEAARLRANASVAMTRLDSSSGMVGA
jgi:DNA-binding PadR family transcriptional regulator